MSDGTDTTQGMATELKWHPWRHARDHYPHITIDCHHVFYGDKMGETSGNSMRLRRGMSQAERRCTATHEIVHIERRGIEHPNPEKEERIVELEAARRLITLQELIDAFVWLRHPTPTELAEHCWVDGTTLLCRMDNLDPIEVAEIEYATQGEWSWAP